MPISKITSNALGPITLINTGSASALTLQTNSSTALTVDTNQRIGIGTSSPSTSLHISNSVTSQLRLSEPNNTYYFDIGRDPNDGLLKFNGNQGNGFLWQNNGSETLRIATSEIKTTLPVNLSGGLVSKRTFIGSGNYTANTYYPIASNSNLTEAGIYIVKLLIDTYNAGGGHYYMIYSSTLFYWYGSSLATNSSSTFVLPTLYGTGHADNGNVVTLQIRLTAGGAGYFLDFKNSVSLTGINDTAGRMIRADFYRIA